MKCHHGKGLLPSNKWDIFDNSPKRRKEYSLRPWIVVQLVVFESTFEKTCHFGQKIKRVKLLWFSTLVSQLTSV